MKNIIIAGIVCALFGVQWSCKKTGPAEAIIQVQDSLGQPVANARVILRQDSVVNPTTGVRADVYQEQVTGGTGEAFFSFELEAVLNIEVSKDSITENDEYVRLEQNETVHKVVVLD
jgi:hypothetical protein